MRSLKKIYIKFIYNFEIPKFICAQVDSLVGKAALYQKKKTR